MAKSYCARVAHLLAATMLLHGVVVRARRRIQMLLGSRVCCQLFGRSLRSRVDRLLQAERLFSEILDLVMHNATGTFTARKLLAILIRHVRLYSKLD